MDSPSEEDGTPKSSEAEEHPPEEDQPTSPGNSTTVEQQFSPNTAAQRLPQEQRKGRSLQRLSTLVQRATTLRQLGTEQQPNAPVEQQRDLVERVIDSTSDIQKRALTEERNEQQTLKVK